MLSRSSAIAACILAILAVLCPQMPAMADDTYKFRCYLASDDNDGDGYAAGSDVQTLYLPRDERLTCPEGYVPGKNDGDDSDPLVYPRRQEKQYNSKDDNCNGLTDEPQILYPDDTSGITTSSFEIPLKINDRETADNRENLYAVIEYAKLSDPWTRYFTSKIPVSVQVEGYDRCYATLTLDELDETTVYMARAQFYVKKELQLATAQQQVLIDPNTDRIVEQLEPSADVHRRARQVEELYPNAEGTTAGPLQGPGDVEGPRPGGRPGVRPRPGGPRPGLRGPDRPPRPPRPGVKPRPGGNGNGNGEGHGDGPAPGPPRPGVRPRPGGQQRPGPRPRPGAGAPTLGPRPDRSSPARIPADELENAPWRESTGPQFQTMTAPATLIVYQEVGPPSPWYFDTTDGPKEKSQVRTKMVHKAIRQHYDAQDGNVGVLGTTHINGSRYCGNDYDWWCSEFYVWSAEKWLDDISDATCVSNLVDYFDAESAHYSESDFEQADRGDYVNFGTSHSAMFLGLDKNGSNNPDDWYIWTVEGNTSDSRRFDDEGLTDSHVPGNTAHVMYTSLTAYDFGFGHILYAHLK